MESKAWIGFWCDHMVDSSTVSKCRKKGLCAIIGMLGLNMGVVNWLSGKLCFFVDFPHFLLLNKIWIQNSTLILRYATFAAMESSIDPDLPVPERAARSGAIPPNIFGY